MSKSKTKIVLFAGTTEGRIIASKLSELNIPTDVYVATDYGSTILESINPSENLKVHTGRLNEEEIDKILSEKKPDFVIDSTHPYADIVSKNIKEAAKNRFNLIRIKRHSVETKSQILNHKNIIFFEDMNSLIVYLNKSNDIIFSSLGSKAADALINVNRFRERIIMRILPHIDGLKKLIDLGYNPKNIICMQGPFGKSLNSEFYKSKSAKILLTKDTGETGGLMDKINPALELNMTIAILKRPKDEISGKSNAKSNLELTLDETLDLIDTEYKLL